MLIHGLRWDSFQRPVLSVSFDSHLDTQILRNRNQKGTRKKITTSFTFGFHIGIHDDDHLACSCSKMQGGGEDGENGEGTSLGLLTGIIRA